MWQWIPGVASCWEAMGQQNQWACAFSCPQGSRAQYLLVQKHGLPGTEQGKLQWDMGEQNQWACLLVPQRQQGPVPACAGAWASICQAKHLLEVWENKASEYVPSCPHGAAGCYDLLVPGCGFCLHFRAWGSMWQRRGECGPQFLCGLGSRNLLGSMEESSGTRDWESDMLAVFHVVSCFFLCDSKRALLLVGYGT
jgi:hypothetical protein